MEVERAPTDLPESRIQCVPIRPASSKSLAQAPAPALLPNDVLPHGIVAAPRSVHQEKSHSPVSAREALCVSVHQSGKVLAGAHESLRRHILTRCFLVRVSASFALQEPNIVTSVSMSTTAVSEGVSISTPARPSRTRRSETCREQKRPTSVVFRSPLSKRRTSAIHC